jgi:hypothetical protein
MKLQFELIFHSRSGECVGNFKVDCIPSKDEARKAGYDFKPYPYVGDLPLAPHILMHMFNEPGDHTGLLVYDRLPKKLEPQLSCGVNWFKSVPAGWGIYITEGYNWKLIVRCIFGVLSLSFLLTLLWCVLKKDMPGAMGIGQYSAAVTALGLSLLVLGGPSRHF